MKQLIEEVNTKLTEQSQREQEMQRRIQEMESANMTEKTQREQEMMRIIEEIEKSKLTEQSKMIKANLEQSQRE